VKQIQFHTSDTASEQYRIQYNTRIISPADADWKSVTKDIKIDADLQLNPLQIKTSSVVGSNQDIHLFFYGEEGLAGGIVVWFTSPIKYWIHYCKNEYIVFPTTPPTDQDKIWSILRTQTRLKVECNGVSVLEYDTSICEKCWRNEVKQIQFHTSDTASEQYRIMSPDG